MSSSNTLLVNDQLITPANLPDLDRYCLFDIATRKLVWANGSPYTPQPHSLGHGKSPVYIPHVLGNPGRFGLAVLSEDLQEWKPVYPAGDVVQIEDPCLVPFYRDVDAVLAGVPFGLEATPRFICWKMTNGEKQPCDTNGRLINAHDPANHHPARFLASYIAASKGKLGLAFVITEKDDYLFIDLDGVRNPATGELNALAQDVLSMFRGAAFEVSASGTGIHLLMSGARYLSKGHRCKVPPHVECYTHDRFVALTGNGRRGNAAYLPCAWDIAAFEAKYLPKQDASFEAGIAGVSSLDDQAALDALLKLPRDAKACPTAALWHGDHAVLAAHFPPSKGRRTDGLPFDHSHADFSLMNALAFVCQRDPDQMERLFSASALGKREKWTKRRDPRKPPKFEYWKNTIDLAIAKCNQTYRQRATFDEIFGGKPGVMPSGANSKPLSPLAPNKDEPRDIRGKSLLAELEQFYTYLPLHQFLYIPTGALWPRSAVNSQISPIYLGKDDKDKDEFMQPATWIDKHRPVQQMTWAPGESQLIKDRVIIVGGWKDKPGDRVFNLYIPPVIKPGDASQAGNWVRHIVDVYGKEQGNHIVGWLAHRVQKPHEKINHALLLGGAQGIGKDTLLEPVKNAIGPWNWQEISPSALLGRFNGFVKSVVLRVNEARDLGDVSRYDFYDRLKTYTAAPPETISCDEKHLKEHPVPNVCGVIITTNYKTDGIYLPADDRRHFVAWSDKKKEDYKDEYWKDLWRWYENGGFENVAAYLRSLDLTPFNPKAPPPKTQTFWEIVDSNCAPEDAELADVLDALGRPDAFVLAQVLEKARQMNHLGLAAFLIERRNSRKVQFRIEAADYVKMRNPDDKRDGLWVINGKRTAAYVKNSLSVRDRHVAIRALGVR